MATLVHAAEHVDQPNWEIQRGAFAPPPTRRIIRGWDRAPVSARAPRLHGQKVWKKLGLKTTNARDIQHEAQEELEKEGGGTRKKLRMLTSRENINDAMWLDAIPNNCAQDIRTTFESNEDQAENPNTEAAPDMDGLPVVEGIPPSNNDEAPNETNRDPAMAVLQFIPRKRTNTDQVITPKKLRQATFERKDQALSLKEKSSGAIAKSTRPRKSLRKSMIASTCDNPSESKSPKVQTRLSSGAQRLNYVEDMASGSYDQQIPLEEPVGKRRVLRRSTITTRQSTAHAEETLEMGHSASQTTELTFQDPTKSIVSTAANLNTFVENFAPNGAEKLLAMSDMAIFTGLEPKPSDVSHELSLTPSPRQTKSDTEFLDTGDGHLLDDSTNSGGGIAQITNACTEGDISTLVETRYGQFSDVSESQKSLTELCNLSTRSTTEDQPVAYKDQDTVGESSRADQVHLPVHTGTTSSLESGHQIPQAELTISQEAPAEPDTEQRIQNADAPEIPDSNNPVTAYDHDDTDMLRNFLTRVKANKAANNPPKRKRSLPHSPLRIPLGDLDNNASPSPLPLQKSNEIVAVESSPSKRKKKPSPLAQCENEPEPRRSGRTKPPAKEPPGAPSFIPVRRLGQDIDTTLTLKRNEEKELAALTRVNTRKNKGTALTALEVLARKSEEKEDPAMRQRLLKEVFDEKMEKGRLDKEKKGREKKIVTWAEELAQFQILNKCKSGESNDDKESEKTVVTQSSEEKKQGAVRVGVRSKAALGMALNGTPAPKRKMRGRV